MSTPTPTKGGKQTAAQQAQAAARRPFITGSRVIDKQTYDQTRTLNASTQRLPTYELDTDGFTAGMYLLVDVVTAGNSAAVTFAADGPFNVLDTVTFADTSNNPILGPMSGHDLYVAVKYGGYSFVDDAKQSPIYRAVTGTGATGGSTTFALLVPIEIVHRDALGALVNKSASAVFKLDITLAANATVYGTAPTNPGSARVRIQQYGWMDPNATDLRGNPVAQQPPALNSVQYWDKQTYTLASGSVSQRLQTFDGLVRNVIFELRDSTGSRAQGDSDFPDPFTLQYETATPIQRVKAIWQHQIGQHFGYTGTADGPGGRDLGTYPETYCRDFGLKPGAESRLGYLPVSAATALRVQGSIGGTGVHTLTALVNYVVPAGGDVRAIAGNR
ncbi:hypothetical protein [Streptomyces albidoflavus]|uniref:hypothetical protein n=1 Tax=Streptomyces albidoflavus TaxID=1886 RepID=UPI0033213947